MLKISQTAYLSSEEFGSTPESRKDIGKSRQILIVKERLESLLYSIKRVIKEVDDDPEYAKKILEEMKRGIFEMLNDYYTSEAGFRANREDAATEVTPMGSTYSADIPFETSKEEAQRVHDTRAW